MTYFGCLFLNEIARLNATWLFGIKMQTTLTVKDVQKETLSLDCSSILFAPMSSTML